MAFLSFFKKHREVFVVLDIGSSSIGAAIVDLHNPKGPCVLFADRHQFHIGDAVSSKRLVLNLKQSLEKVLTDVQHFVSKKSAERLDIQKIVCTYCSPWHSSSTKTVTIEEEGQTLVTHSLVSDILKTEERNLMKMLEEDTALQVKKPLLLDQKLIQIKLNGYATNNPYEKEAAKIELTFFTTIASGNLINEIETLIHKMLHVRDIKHHAFSLVAWDVISDTFSYIKNFIHVDITGEVSDITVVDSGNIREIASVPSGRHLVIRTIAKRLNVDEEIALSYLHVLSQGAANQKLTSELTGILTDVQTEFKILLEDTFKRMESRSDMPGTIFLTADGDVATLFAESFKKMREDSKVILLNNESMPTHCTFSKLQETDNFIAIESVFLHKLNSLQKKS
jgi:hypothetical protein